MNYTITVSDVMVGKLTNTFKSETPEYAAEQARKYYSDLLDCEEKDVNIISMAEDHEITVLESTQYVFKEDLDRLNEFIDKVDFTDISDEMSEYTRSIGAREDDNIYVADWSFKNGNYVTLHVCSGGSNYYDNMVLYDKYGNELYFPDCVYHIYDVTQFYYDDVLYVCKLTIIKE